MTNFLKLAIGKSHNIEDIMLKLNKSCHNRPSFGAKMLANFMRRGFSAIYEFHLLIQSQALHEISFNHT